MRINISSQEIGSETYNYYPSMNNMYRYTVTVPDPLLRISLFCLETNNVISQAKGKAKLKAQIYKWSRNINRPGWSRTEFMIGLCRIITFRGLAAVYRVKSDVLIVYKYALSHVSVHYWIVHFMFHHRCSLSPNLSDCKVAPRAVTHPLLSQGSASGSAARQARCNRHHPHSRHGIDIAKPW